VITPIKQVPCRCIWCLRESPDATFRSESHVLPECVGNKWQQVLPPGIVCDKCNNYFGSNVEPILLDDPLFKTIVGILQLRDKEDVFAYERSPSGIHRNIHIDTSISGNIITVTTQYKIQGQPNRPYEDRQIPPESKKYDKRSIALLSRAVHKIAFESLAHSLFVGTGSNITEPRFKDIDIFDYSFNNIRDWVRYERPNHTIRTVLRVQKFNEVKTQDELFYFGGELRRFHQCFYYNLNLYCDWYIVSLTSLTDKAEDNLISFVKGLKFNSPVLMVREKIQFIE
jgi:hypothetical protein